MNNIFFVALIALFASNSWSNDVSISQIPGIYRAYQIVNADHAPFNVKVTIKSSLCSLFIPKVLELKNNQGYIVDTPRRRHGCTKPMPVSGSVELSIDQPSVLFIHEPSQESVNIEVLN